jgi:hypothetical protein
MISVMNIFEPKYYSPRRVFVVSANGGSVTVEIKTGDDEWFLDSTYTEDISKIIFQYGSTIRITPTGGAEYAVE